MTNPSVAIAIVVRNAIEHIEGTISSVLSIKRYPVEVVVVDGVSTDGTKEYLASLGSALDIFISEPDDGIYSAMNKAALAATADYIVYINSGDYILSETAFVNAIKSIVGHDILYAPVLVCSTNRPRKLVRPGRLTSLYRRMQFSHQAAFTRRSLIISNQFDSRYCIAADHKFYFNAFQEGATFALLEYPFSVVSKGGFSEQHPVRAYIENLLIYVEYGISFTGLTAHLLQVLFIIIHTYCKRFILLISRTAVRLINVLSLYLNS